MSLDISYEEYNKKLDIHGTVLYPAVMVAPVQKEVLTWLMNGRKNLKVFDPFHGSGTALYEALDIDSSVSIIGYDINPLASLITLVKLQGINHKDFIYNYQLLESLLKSEIEFPIISFYKSDKWFNPGILESLSKVSYSISKIENKQNRQYLWVMFCDIIRRYSNTRSSTYKLHIKPQDQIDSIKNNIINDFLNKVKSSQKYYNNHFTNYNLKKGDSLKLIREEEDDSIDILVTSPPYGDNATTVPYGQFSYLPLSFIDKKDLEFEGWELKTCQTLDSSSIGGSYAKVNMREENQKLIQSYLTKITKDKRKKVIRFFSDYFDFLDQAARVTRQYIVMTLGNRTVSRVKINLTRVTEKYLESKGFIRKQKMSRKISSKRTPNKILVDNKLIETMNKEYVLIMEKKHNKDKEAIKWA